MMAIPGGGFLKGFKGAKGARGVVKGAGRGEGALHKLRPVLDGTGKVHGPLPSSIPKSWSHSMLRELAADLRISIGTRRREMRRLGEDGPHRRRLQQEERLLRQIEKRLSGS